MDIREGPRIGTNIEVQLKGDSNAQPVHNSDDGTPNAKHVVF